MSDFGTGRRRFLRLAAQGALTLPLLACAGSPGARTAPRTPSVSLNVREFGAAGDGATRDTSALQRALDRCGVFGGGEVVVPAGNYLTGALQLRSHTRLRFEDGAILTGTADFADYPVTQVRWEGRWRQGHIGLIHAIGAEDIEIAGPGRIVGNPALGGRPDGPDGNRHPALIEFVNCRGIRLEGFSTSYHRMWSVHPTNCEDISIRDLTIRSTGGNGDGIDVDSCRNVTIEGCDIATGDDCISLKSGRGSEANMLMRPTENVVIRNCSFADSIFACIGIGSETSGGIRNVRIEHCRFTAAKTYALYIKSHVGRGAFIDDIIAEDLDVSGMTGGFLRYNILGSGLQDEYPVAGLDGVPSLRNHRFSRIRLTDCPVLVEGTALPEEKPLDGFTLSDVTGSCAHGISLANIRNAVISDIKVTGVEGPLLSIHNVTGHGLEGAAAIDGPAPVPPVPPPAEPYRLK